MNRHPLQWRLGLGSLGLIAIACSIVSANAVAAPVATNRFALSGSASLSVDAPAQSGGRFVIRGAVASPPASDLTSVRTSGRFELASTLAAASVPCYNDTIFRDSVDATGL